MHTHAFIAAQFSSSKHSAKCIKDVKVNKMTVAKYIDVLPTAFRTILPENSYSHLNNGHLGSLCCTAMPFSISSSTGLFDSIQIFLNHVNGIKDSKITALIPLQSQNSHSPLRKKF